MAGQLTAESRGRTVMAPSSGPLRGHQLGGSRLEAAEEIEGQLVELPAREALQPGFIQVEAGGEDISADPVIDALDPAAQILREGHYPRVLVGAETGDPVLPELGLIRDSRWDRTTCGTRSLRARSRATASSSFEVGGKCRMVTQKAGFRSTRQSSSRMWRESRPLLSGTATVLGQGVPVAPWRNERGL